MDRKFGNYAALRQQVVTSSPELRALESKLGACALTCYNRAAAAEREASKKLKDIGDREYCDLVKQLDGEEKVSASLTVADKELKNREVQEALKEQIHAKSAERAKVEAEKVVNMMAEVDETKLMEKEKKEHLARRIESQRLSGLVLEKQTRIKKLMKEEEELQDRRSLRSAEEYNLRAELTKEMDRLRSDIQRHKQNRQELSLVLKLEEQQREREVIQDTRLELEIMERSALERKLEEEREESKQGVKEDLMRGLDEQVRLKMEREARAREKEEQYKELLLQIMAEEGRLEQLVAGARRRRQLDHRALVESMLEERRVRRQKLMREHILEGEQERVYNELRKSILEEEERQLLLKYAPHLLPYFTADLRARMRELL